MHQKIVWANRRSLDFMLIAVKLLFCAIYSVARFFFITSKSTANWRRRRKNPNEYTFFYQEFICTRVEKRNLETKFVKLALWSILYPRTVIIIILNLKQYKAIRFGRLIIIMIMDCIREIGAIDCRCDWLARKFIKMHIFYLHSSLHSIFQMFYSSAHTRACRQQQRQHCCFFFRSTLVQNYIKFERAKKDLNTTRIWWNSAKSRVHCFFLLVDSLQTLVAAAAHVQFI